MEKQQYFKVMKKNECHHGFQYKTGLNVDTLPFENDPTKTCCPGGLYFTDLNNISKYLNYGDSVREVSLPTEDTDFRMVKDGDDKWRANKIILGKKWLTEDFIREFQDNLKWNTISWIRKLSEELINDFHDRVNWSYISSFQNLSENLIREFKDQVDWHSISAHQNLSEDFIREFQERVYWSYISSNQNLSENFIREFEDRVDWNSICKLF